MTVKKAARESRVLSRTGEKKRQRETLVIQSLLGHSLGKERESQWNQWMTGTRGLFVVVASSLWAWFQSLPFTEVTQYMPPCFSLRGGNDSNQHSEAGCWKLDMPAHLGLTHRSINTSLALFFTGELTSAGCTSQLPSAGVSLYSACGRHCWKTWWGPEDERSQSTPYLSLSLDAVSKCFFMWPWFLPDRPAVGVASLKKLQSLCPTNTASSPCPFSWGWQLLPAVVNFCVASLSHIWPLS